MHFYLLLRWFRKLETYSKKSPLTEYSYDFVNLLISLFTILLIIIQERSVQVTWFDSINDETIQIQLIVFYVDIHFFLSLSG